MTAGLLQDDGSMATDTWARVPDWSCFRSNSTLSHSDPCSSFMTLDGDLDAIQHRYRTLWEIQLELGEIPDMISNNLLEPCFPSHTTGPVPEAYFGQQYLHDEEEQEVKQEDEGALVRRKGDVSNSEREHFMQPRLLLGLKNHPTTRVNQDEEEYGCSEYEFEDEEVRDKDEEGWRDEVVNHPVYGMLTCALEVQGGEFRHDRKDSGVFVYSDDREGFLDGPFTFPEHSLKLFPASSAWSADADREQHGHSAAYISLQCIASSFST